MTIKKICGTTSAVMLVTPLIDNTSETKLLEGGEDILDMHKRNQNNVTLELKFIIVEFINKLRDIERL